MSGYSRDKFPHWVTVSGTCNPRESVRRRDGTNVVVDASCAAGRVLDLTGHTASTRTAPVSSTSLAFSAPTAATWRPRSSSTVYRQPADQASPAGGSSACAPMPRPPPARPSTSAPSTTPCWARARSAFRCFVTWWERVGADLSGLRGLGTLGPFAFEGVDPVAIVDVALDVR